MAFHLCHEVASPGVRIWWSFLLPWKLEFLLKHFAVNILDNLFDLCGSHLHVYLLHPCPFLLWLFYHEQNCKRFLMPFDVDLYRKVAYSALHFLMTFSIRGQRLDAFMYQCLGALQFTLFISLLTFIYIPSHLAPHQITCAEWAAVCLWHVLVIGQSLGNSSGGG